MTMRRRATSRSSGLSLRDVLISCARRGLLPAVLAGLSAAELRLTGSDWSVFGRPRQNQQVIDRDRAKPRGKDPEHDDPRPRRVAEPLLQ